MKLEVGMYVRTKYGHIAKLIDIDYKDEYYEFDEGIVWFYEYYKDMFGFNDEDLKQITKTSHSIMDLIEVGDYVNGEKIDYISISKDGRKRPLIRDNIYLFDKYKSINSILTKEQFKQMSYEIGAEDDTN